MSNDSFGLYCFCKSERQIHNVFSEILETADKGSVIAKDHSVGILIKLAVDKNYRDKVLSVLLNILKSCAINQLPMYAERAMPVISDKYKSDFIRVLSERLVDIDKESKVKRIEMVIKNLNK